jgi:RNA polymerase sigma-70 factor, ECF subfamily
MSPSLTTVEPWALPSTPAERASFVDDLFSKLYQPLRVMCRHLVATDADADDLVQEAFFLAARGLTTFRGECSTSTWVFRIALRCAAKKAIRQKRDVPLEAANEPASSSAPVDEAVEARRRLEKVRAALERLPLDQRAVLAMSAIDGLPHRVIAETLGIPEGTVGSRLHQARKRLALELATSIDQRGRAP